MGCWESIKERLLDTGRETRAKRQHDGLVCDFFLGRGIDQNRVLLRAICFVSVLILFLFLFGAVWGCKLR